MCVEEKKKIVNLSPYISSTYENFMTTEVMTGIMDITDENAYRTKTAPVTMSASIKPPNVLSAPDVLRRKIAAILSPETIHIK